MTAVVDFVNVETRPIKWIIDKFKNDTLIVDNSFQRRFVWIEKHQVSLMETILKGMPVPEIYLWKQEVDYITGNEKHSIIDGQQRLRSVYRYVNDEFSLKKEYLEDKDAEYVNKKFTELSSEDKRKIWSYSFSIRFVREQVSNEDIINMFLRLNNTGTFLNPQELRNAKFGGRFIELAEEISEFPFWGKYSIFNPNDIRRMRDIQFISSILIFFRKGIEEETTQSNINQIYDTYNEVYEEYENDKDLFLKILSGVEKIIGNDEMLGKFLKKQTHLYTLMVTIYYFMKINESGDIENQEIQNYKRFVQAYIDGSNQLAREYFGDEFVGKINEYRRLSSTGTQAKPNRAERFSILKSTLLSQYSPLKEVLKTSIANLGTSVRTYKVLEAAKINTLGDLVQYDIKELLKFDNFGEKTFLEIEKLLVEKGLTFGMDLSGTGK